MRLTLAVLRFVRRSHIPGTLYSGKHRLYPPVTVGLKKEAVKQLIMEQNNLDLISKPYLTEEEDRGHMLEINKQVFEELKMRQKEERWLKPRLMDEHLDHLNVEKKWE